jgi:hypothetical protein
MKKIKIIIWLVIPVLVLALAGFYVLRPKIYPNSDSAKKSVSGAANPSPVLNLHSFKGVLSSLVEAVAGNTTENSQNPSQDSVPPGDKKTQDSYSFAIIGDTKLFEESYPDGNLGKAVASIAKQNVDMTFAVGDLVFKCINTVACGKSYADWKNELSPLISKTYEVVGNHDQSGGNLADDVWQKEFDLPTNGPPGFQKQVYSFDFQNSHFVILDTEKPQGGGVNGVQLTWLQQDLAAHKGRHTFVFFHEPAYPSNQSTDKSLYANPKQRDALWKILADNNVTATIKGHEHIFTRKKIGSIYQFVVGNTDAPQNATPKPGLADYAFEGNFYAIIAVTGAKMNLSLYSVDGKLINSFDFS